MYAAQLQCSKRLTVMTPKNLTFLAFLVVLLASPIAVVESKSDGLGEWHLLTEQNFSSQIRLHPHILLIITLPWSGESRSFMKDVARSVTDREEEFSSLKLMFMHINSEKTVVDGIGASTDAEETTVLYYHNSVSYKYRGRLRAQNVIFSLRPYVAVVPEELPLKSLITQEDMRVLLDSTDKALILFEFCDWTPKLLARMKMNGTADNGFGVQGDLLGFNFSGDTNRTPRSRGVETSKMKCDVDYGLGGIPWFGDFVSVNDSAAFEESQKTSFCTLGDYQLFESFFLEFMTVARDHFLPPERHKFGLVSERSMLSSSNLGTEDSSSWLAVLYFSGCPSCSKIIRKEDDLKKALQIDTFLRELEDGGKTLEPALPANQPSVLLFVDRSSKLSETRITCKEALDAFRELALDYHISHQISGLKSLVQGSQVLRSTSGHPKLKLSQIAQLVKIKDKMSTMMIVNEGKQVTSDKIAWDLQGGSFKEILDIVLKQKTKSKLSSLAKELGFQLLSDDLDIKLVNTLPIQAQIQSNQFTQDLSKEDLVTDSDDTNKDQSLCEAVISAEERLESAEEHTSEVANFEISSQIDAEKTTFVDSKQKIAGHKLDAAEDLKIEESSSQLDEPWGQQLHFQGFEGSFFFSDGNYRLIRALTRGLKIPALVIVDPIAQMHYVFPEETNVSYSSLAGFIAGYVNGSLLPYQQSESVVQSSREATQPPFVNLDFHQVDSIPRVTCRTFSELVIGFNQSDSDAWNKDVLVLFSNRWCGFCQRMELVVHEVYRAMKDYIRMLKSGSKSDKAMFQDGDGDLKDEMPKLPLLYLMDCTLNDCSLILKSMNQREVYPALVLFPAEKKIALPYHGDMAVTEIFKFVADHGSNSHHLISEKGILWTGAKKGGRNQNLFKVQSSDIHEEDSVEKDTLHEVLLAKTRFVIDNQAKSHSQGLHEAALSVVPGSVLVASDKLLTVHPFDKSKILVVKADQVTGFQGLIINKHVRWDSLHELEKGLEMLAAAPLSFGGPLLKVGMPLVALTRRFVNNEYPEVLPGVFYLDQSATNQKMEELKLGNQSVSDYWFFFGYSSWGWEQLMDEIAQGAWTLTDDALRHFNWPLS